MNVPAKVAEFIFLFRNTLVNSPARSDGLIRFNDNTTIFINDTRAEPEKKWLQQFQSVLKENNLQPVELPAHGSGSINS